VFGFRKFAWLCLSVTAVWFLSSPACFAAPPPCSASVPTCSFTGGYRLKAGQSVQAGGLTLAMQKDGNLVLYQSGAALWATSYLPVQDAAPFSGPTYGMNCTLCFAAFQTDGNLVLYQPGPGGIGSVPYWASNTPQNSGATFSLSPASPLAIVNTSGSVVWTADIAGPATAATTPTSGGVRIAIGPNGTPGSLAASYEQWMGQLWNRSASFQPIVNMQIQTMPANGAAFVDGMDEGTRIVVANGAWYLFSREYDYAANPSQCKSDFSRIVVRTSTNHGAFWSREAVVAEPNLALGECALADGHAYWDAETGTWHYLTQVLTSDGAWNIDHFSLAAQNPAARFAADPANPVIRSGALWSSICAQGKSCPPGGFDEGTPEISLKSNGLYYVTFHGVSIGANAPQVVAGYRGIAATADFHSWTTSGAGLPGDAIWSPRDCQGWSISWNPTTGCVGGGEATSLIAAQHTYMLIESSDLSVGCVAGQNWAIGLVRAPSFVASGQWEQYPGNPLMSVTNGAPCGVQYVGLFADSGQVYVSYWTMGPSGAGDPNTYFHIAKLRTN
jgi:hypothetical protein